VRLLRSAVTAQGSLGLHWDVSGEGDYKVGRMSTPAAIREAFQRQLDAFSTLTGRMPTHIDSHHHLHRRADILPVFRELVEPLGLPLRNDSNVHFIGGFYAQWEWMVTNLEYVSVPTLQRILQEEVSEGWTEVACHPGYVTPDFSSVYLQEREIGGALLPTFVSACGETNIRGDRQALAWCPANGAARPLRC
jgi:chitin disaccharide deacetylase